MDDKAKQEFLGCLVPIIALAMTAYVLADAMGLIFK